MMIMMFSPLTWIAIDKPSNVSPFCVISFPMPASFLEDQKFECCLSLVPLQPTETNSFQYVATFARVDSHDFDALHSNGETPYTLFIFATSSQVSESQLNGSPPHLEISPEAFRIC